MLTVLGVLALACAACSTGDPSSDAVVRAITDETLVPAIERAASSTSDLTGAVSDLCADPTESRLQTARDAWVAARQSWREAEPLIYFGPADMLRTLSMGDYWPISEDGIEDLLASGAEIDLDYMENRAASTQRGLGAVEYVLFDEVGSALDPQRCRLAAVSTQVASEHIEELHIAWTDAYREGPSYAEQFTAMEPGDSLSDLVGALVAAFHQHGSRELGTALGATVPEPDPRALPEGRAGSATSDYLARARGISALLEAGGEGSLIALIRDRSPEVADRIETTMSNLVSELEGLPEGPMASLLSDDPARLELAYEHLTEMHALFEADVLSALDITLGFSDTDGDSG